MKKIYYLFTNLMPCLLLMFLAVQVGYSQCPLGQTEVTVTMDNEGFDGENGWMLWDATAATTVTCINSDPQEWFDGTSVSACITDGNDIELYGYESFGDGWNGGTLLVETTEDGTVNGADPQNVLIFDGGSGASDNDQSAGTADGGVDCTMPNSGANQVGDLMVTFVTTAFGCQLVCPDDVVVPNEAGTCEATVDVPAPVLQNPLCEILESPVFDQIVGPQTDYVFVGGTLAASTYSIPVPSGGVDAAVTCAAEVCIDFVEETDNSFGGETRELILEDGSSFFIVNDGGLDCEPDAATLCIPVMTYNTWAADGSLDFDVVANTAVNLFCADNFIQGTVNIPVDCVSFTMTPLNGPTLPIGSAVFPVGTTCVTINGTGSGTGTGSGSAVFPIECEVKITVEDVEAPTLVCPGDFTFNLQGGECEQIYDYEVIVTDNCPVGAQEIEGIFGPIGNCTGAGASLSCGATPTSQVQEFDITGFPATSPVQINEACFIYDGASWGATLATVNFYIAPSGAQAAQTPMPCIDTDMPVATSGLVDVSSFGASGTDVCIPILDMTGQPFVVPAGSPGLYMEVRTPAGALSWNGGECNGIPSDGTNTYLCSVNCGAGYYADFGFDDIDAFFSFNGEVLPPEIPPTPGLNEFASGDALPIGVHCFEVNAIDFAGNTSSCEWCVTVNEFPEDQIVTSLACNDLVNVSLNEDCEAFISADMFLEGGPYGCYFNGYEVYIEGVNGGADVNGQTLELDPGVYTVTVYDAIRDNACWGEMLVEDKLPPSMPPIEDLVVTCKDDVPNVLSTARSFPANVPVAAMEEEAITSAEPEQFLSFEVIGDCPIEDLNVAVELEHTWVGDIELDLISPSGTSVTLLDNNCGNTDDLNVVFDDEGIAFDCGQASPGSGVAMQTAGAVGSLSDFDGEIMGGTWMIRWDDTVGGDVGEFVSFSLAFNDGDVTCGATVTASDYLSAVGSACEIVDLVVVQEEAVGNDCDGTTILRTWVATDAAGNSTTKVQTITQERIGVDAVGDEWFWPAPQVDLTCDADPSPDAIYAYFRGLWEAANPCPLPTCDPTDLHAYDPAFVALWECNANAAGVQYAYPFSFNDKGLQESFLTNACNIFFTYSDQVLPACGADCNGNNKVIRTWTALDWCTGQTENAVQVIHAKDNEGPTASPLAPMTVSANPWGCAANFTLPVPEHLADNCSDVVTYRIYGEPGTVTEILAGPRPLLDEDDNVVLDENGYPVWVVEGLPKGMAPYNYTYELSDCCGNVSYLTLQVTVVDGAAPQAIAKQNIVLSLTSSPTDPSGGSAKLYATSVDNGSHDGDCGPVRIAIRRLDDGVCNNLGDRDHENNTTFFNFNDLPNSQQPANHDRDDTDNGEFVKFCCQDFIDGEGEDLDGDGINDYVLIDVELGVWDDANMDGVPGTPGDLFGVTWATVRVEAKLQPNLVCPPLAKITCDMDEKDLAVTGGAASATSTCGALDVVYEDLCGLDINQDGVISEFIVEDPAGMLINEVGMCTDVNRDGVIANYTAAWWSTVDEDLFNKACHYGPITRWWSIAGTEYRCRQLIIIERPNSLQEFDGSVSIDWPYSEDEFIRLADNDGDDCGLMEVSGGDIEQFDTNGDDIPDFAEVRLSCIDGLCDEPTWVDATCSLVGWSLDSDTFYFEGDACRKIINTYTVIDWCQYNPNDPFSGGIWEWTVIGKLIDTYPPVVEAGDDMFEAVPGSGGSGTDINEQPCVGVGIQMSATAYDTNVDANGDTLENACPSEWLKWNVYLDINNDWVFDREWSSFVAEDRNTSTDPLWSEDNLFDNLSVYGYAIPDVRVGNRGGVDNATDFATEPNFEYTINIPDAIPADCGETQHRVVWKVYDGCGNVSSTTSYFTVQDKKAPTPYCINLSTALMADPDGAGPAVSMVELWAIDFNAGSFDNCTDTEDLRFTFSDVEPSQDPTYNPALRSSARIFTCDDLNGTNDSTVGVGVYVWDDCNNYDFCMVNLRLVDNNPDGCTDTTGTGSIAGKIYTEFGENIEGVEVMNENMLSETEVMDMTSNAGQYNFYANELANDYQLTATKDSDYLNGVSTLDLVLIQRHILGLESLDSPYKLIAADANNDGQVTAIDLIELRKLILGIYDELPSNSSWRFVDAAQTLDINSPWNFDETIDIYNLTDDMMEEDFVGVKIGDVNESVEANATSGTTDVPTSAAINIEYEDIAVEAGQTVDLAINGDDFNNVYGYQFTLSTPGLELVSVQSEGITVDEGNFASVGNAVTTSWNTEVPVSANGTLFTMTFRATTSGKLSDILNVNSAVTKAEAYVGANLDIVNIDLRNGTEAAAEFALYDNEPNPFITNTTIGFLMPETADATLTVLDVNGKVVRTIVGNYAKGYNEIELSKSDLGAAGVYYYQLDSGDFTATKKMIIIE